MINWQLENYRVKCTNVTADGRSCNAPLMRAVHSHSVGGYSGEIEVCRPENELMRAHASILSNSTGTRLEDQPSSGTRSYGSTELTCPKCGTYHHFSASETATILKSIRATIDKYQSDK